MTRTPRSVVVTAVALAAACAGAAHLSTPSPTVVNVTMRDANSVNLGTLTLTENYAGILIAGWMNGLSAGTHAIHIHETGKCDAPFQTAGGHFNPEHKHHGFSSPEGWHAGDLPSIEAPASGTARFEILAPGLRFTGANGILDDNGS